MKNRASAHILVLLLIFILTAIAHYAIHYGALIRGYEVSWMSGVRNLSLLFVLTILPLVLTRFTRFQGNWTLYTTAVLLFSIGLTVQFRLFNDLEYASRDRKAEARQAKIKTLQEHYIQENYSAEKKQMMGLPATPPSPVDLSKEKPRPSNETLIGVVFSGRTLFPLLGIGLMFAAYYLMKRDRILELLQKNGFLIVLVTLIPITLAAITSSGGKVANMTPWEPSKIPFLIGFAAILAVLYRKLMQTYWGIPRAQDVLPLLFMAILPFLPFFVLKDFGQMLVFSSVYVTLYLIAVRRLPQRIVFVGSVALVVAVLMLSALPPSVQVKVPLLSTLAEPVRTILPPRIHQRFHLWFDALTPPPPDTDFWKGDLADFYWKQYRTDLVERKPETQALYDELGKIEENKNADSAAKKRASDIRAELKKIAMQDIADIYAQTKDFSAPQTGEQPPTDEDEIRTRQEEQRELRELKEKLDAMNEEAWFGDDALQASRATFGVSSGGKTGRGLGLGYVELIPVADSDYIYAAIGEELGLFGGLLITFALITFVSAGVRTALDARDMFSKLCAAGLTAFIGFQALVNMGGITRALPMTGITLPFVSHGGFSLITSFVMLGMLLAISHRNAVDANISNGSKQ